jgi:dipeptidase D
MVCEKNKETVHDFSKEPIEIVRKGNVLMANGTTLGADNGIAVATNLAIMEDSSLVHGPLEFLFTVDEETGLTGASNLNPGALETWAAREARTRSRRGNRRSTLPPQAASRRSSRSPG